MKECQQSQCSTGNTVSAALLAWCLFRAQIQIENNETFLCWLAWLAWQMLRLILGGNLSSAILSGVEGLQLEEL